MGKEIQWLATRIIIVCKQSGRQVCQQDKHYKDLLWKS